MNVRTGDAPTTIRVASSSTASRITGERTANTPQSFANLQKPRSVRSMTDAGGPTTELSVFTIATNTKPSFATIIQTRLASVNTGITARLLTQSKTSKSGSSTTWCQASRLATSIFSSSTSRPNGAPSTTSTIKLNAFMPTTFKTLEEGQIYSGMRLKSAKTGRAGHLSLHTMKAVSA